MNLKKILLKIRLTHYLIGFVIIYFGISLLIPKIELTGSALTLFSVNSFLYGFYLSPIIRSQHGRISRLHKLIIAEINKLQEIYQYARRSEPEFRDELAQKIHSYAVVASNGNPEAGQAEFEAISETIIKYKGEAKDPHKEMMKSIFSAQQNREEIKFLAKGRVYSNEWIVMSILFSITILFILLIELPGLPILMIMPAILCAGLSMLIVILVKMSTLTHKRAKSMWIPMRDFAHKND